MPKKFIQSVVQSYLFIFFVLQGAVSTAMAEELFALPDGHEVAPLEMFQECDVCPEMIVLPQDRFVMGAPLEDSAQVYLFWHKPKPGEPIGMAQEGPEHEVIIDMPIAMGRNKVTHEEWMACVSDGGCSHVPDPRILTMNGYLYADDPRDPVFDVSYLDVLEYVAWLNRKTGTNAYRLPTEAEWEYAARAGTHTKFGQGDSLTMDQANFAVFHHEGERYVYDPISRKTPVPVDMLDAANAWGLRHMAGNVLEKTMSCWSSRHLGLPTSSAYLADALGSGTCLHVVKGGSFGRSSEYARPANRGAEKMESRSISVGFRIVREME